MNEHFPFVRKTIKVASSKECHISGSKARDKTVSSCLQTAATSVLAENSWSSENINPYSTL